MRYYDTRTNTEVEAEYLRYNGLPSNDAELSAIGVYPVVDEMPEYDVDLFRLEKDGDPIRTGEIYSQHWKIVSLPLDAARANLKTAITQKRWQVETGGVTLPDGTVVLTGIEDQNRVATAIQGMRDSGMLEVDFKAESGWVSLTLDQLVAVSTAIAEHVQKCFSYERFLHELVDVCDSVVAIQTVDSNSDWPEPQIDGNKTSTGERT